MTWGNYIVADGWAGACMDGQMDQRLDRPMDGGMGGPTDGQTKPLKRVACLQLKTGNVAEVVHKSDRPFFRCNKAPL